MKKKNRKKLIIIVSSIVLFIGIVLAIGFISEANRQENIIGKVSNYVQDKAYYGKEADSDYVMTLTFHKNTENKLTVNFGKESIQDVYYTFKGTYKLYFKNSQLYMDVDYYADALDDLNFKKETFKINYKRNGDITQLVNLGEEGQTSTFTLSNE